MKIAIQGIKGSYHHIVAKKYFDMPKLLTKVSGRSRFSEYKECTHRCAKWKCVACNRYGCVLTKLFKLVLEHDDPKKVENILQTIYTKTNLRSIVLSFC